MKRVQNESVWHHTRTIFLSALILFLINILLGFDNAVTTGPLPQWQFLTHLHAGALGWITLSAIGLAFWLFTGQRNVSATYARRIRWLGWLTVIAFAAYIGSIAIAFSQRGETFMLLPVFGSAAALLLWIVVVVVIAQWRTQPVPTTVHLLLIAGLLVAAVGATIGVVLGTQYATGVVIISVEAHAPVMLFYLFLAAGAIVEWIVHGDTPTDWTWAGLAQAVVLVIGAAIPPIAFTFELMMLAPVMLVMLFLFLLIFVIRIGWRALYTNPFVANANAWAFFGTVWLILLVLLFPAEIVLQPNPPEWLLPVLAHVGFVGMMTNLLFGVLSTRTDESRILHAWAEPTAMWGLNLGLVVFFGLRIGMDSRLGALAMGAGVLLGVIVMAYRLLTDPAGRG